MNFQQLCCHLIQDQITEPKASLLLFLSEGTYFHKIPETSASPGYLDLVVNQKNLSASAVKDIVHFETVSQVC